MVQFKSPQGKVYYMNKRTGHVQDLKPPNFHETRVEEQSFSTVRLADGSEITTFLDEHGQQMFLDWETQVRVLPADIHFTQFMEFNALLDLRRACPL